MTTVDIHEAKTQLSRLLERALGGEEIIIAKAGRPIARIVPLTDARRRVPGTFRDKIQIQGDFDDPLPDDVIADFEGRSE